MLRLRPIDSADRDGIADLFARRSPESRSRRFLGPKPHLSSRELTYLTRIDHVHHEAIAAVDDRDGSIVVDARFVRHADRPDAADVAVADDWQGRGVGAALAQRPLRCATEIGVAVLTASALRENTPAWALLKRLGFRACGQELGVVELEATIA